MFVKSTYRPRLIAENSLFGKLILVFGSVIVSVCRLSSVLIVCSLPIYMKFVFIVAPDETIVLLVAPSTALIYIPLPFMFNVALSVIFMEA